MARLNRNLNFSVDASTFAKGIPAGLGPTGTTQLDVRNAFTQIALRKAPPISHGFQINETWAHLRYAQSLGPGPGLRLREEWSALDSHEKTILSDDWGVGFAFAVLSSRLKIRFATSTTYWMQQNKTASLKKRPKRGVGKTPDFVIEDTSGRFHVLECKGSQSSMQHLLSAMHTGRAQKQNLRFPKSYKEGLRLVAGLFVPQFESKEQATLHVIDPPPPDSPTISESPDDLREIIARGELASCLCAGGEPSLANIIAAPGADAARSGAILDRVRDSAANQDGFFVMGAERDAVRPATSPEAEARNSLVIRLKIDLIERALRRERLTAPKFLREPETFVSDAEVRHTTGLGVELILDAADDKS